MPGRSSSGCPGCRGRPSSVVRLALPRSTILQPSTVRTISACWRLMDGRGSPTSQGDRSRSTAMFAAGSARPIVLRSLASTKTIPVHGPELQTRRRPAALVCAVRVGTTPKLGLLGSGIRPRELSGGSDAFTGPPLRDRFVDGKPVYWWHERPASCLPPDRGSVPDSDGAVHLRPAACPGQRYRLSAAPGRS